MSIFREFNINMIPGKPPLIVHASQYESDFVYTFNLISGKSVLAIPDTAIAVIRGTKRDGNGFSKEASLDTENNKVVVIGEVQMTACAGKNVFELAILNDEKTICTANFFLDVERAPLDSDTIQSETVLHDLQAIINSAATATQAAEEASASAAEAAESARTLTIDPTLTQSGQAADAKVVGDEIEGVKEDLSQIANLNPTIGKNLVNPENIIVGGIQSDGTIRTDGTYPSYGTTDFIPIDPSTNYVFSYFTNSTKTIQNGRKIVAYFDASKNAISAEYVNQASGDDLVINSASAKYIRVSAFLTNMVFQVEKGSVSTAYEPYEESGTDIGLKIILGEVPTAQVQSMIDTAVADIGDTSEYFDEVNGTNLLNQSAVVTGGLQSDGTIRTDGSYANYGTSDFIELKPNTYYTFAYYTNSVKAIQTGRHIVLLYDADKSPITSSYQSVDAVSSLSLNSGTAKYIRVSAYLTSMVFQLSEGNTEIAYYPYIQPYIGLTAKLGAEPLAQVDRLYGKKWAVCGDSFTNGATATVLSEGKYTGQKYVYPYLIGNRTGMEILKFFEGGRTLAYPANPSTFVNSLTCPSQDFYYQNIPADVDYITIYLGINDEHHATGGGDGEDATGVIPLGTINDTTTDTYYGAWNVVLTWLIENRPFAHIGIIVSNGLSIEGYRTAQLEIAKKYGIPYMDLNGDSRTPVMIRSINTDIASAVRTAVTRKQAVDYDGTTTGSVNLHPNDDAQLFESTFIESFLRNI